MTTIQIELSEDTAKAARDAGLLTPQALERLLIEALQRHDDIEALRMEIQKGIDSGPGIPAEQVFDRLETKYCAVAQNRSE
ncbi:MAG: hypothetical protein Q7N95_17970 [Alphaproteobacteria bacterium]|nr:hypothetical protein [Alphaproteobacteria bacterium]